MLEVGDEIRVDPAMLRISPSRFQGADPGKLQTAIFKFAKSIEGMPPLWGALATYGELVIVDGMTRATRIAKLSPGTLVPVVITELRRDKGSKLPTIKDLLP